MILDMPAPNEMTHLKHSTRYVPSARCSFAGLIPVNIFQLRLQFSSSRSAPAPHNASPDRNARRSCRPHTRTETISTTHFPSLVTKVHGGVDEALLFMVIELRFEARRFPHINCLATRNLHKQPSQNSPALIVPYLVR